MSDAKWETVGATKKGKQNGASKGQQKSQDKMLQALNGPKAESETLYQHLEPKEKKTTPKLSQSDSKIPKPKKTQPKVKSLENELKDVDLTQIYENAKNTYKDNPLAVLKDVISRLNNKVEHLPMPDVTHAKRGNDYPLSMLNVESVETLRKAMSSCQADLLQVFLEQVILTALSDIKKGHSTWGYQMSVQLLSLVRPEVLTANLSKYQDILIKHKSNVPGCMSVLWMLGRAGEHNFKSGLKVWLVVMLPLLGIKSLAPYAITYLVNLLKKARDEQKLGSAAGVIDVKQYLLILDGAFNQSIIQPTVKKQLRESYNDLAKIAMVPSNNVLLSQFFPSLLTRLSDSNSRDLKTELCLRLTNCIREDKTSLDTWKAIYDKHLVQSRLLLEHISSKWSELSLVIDSRSLCEFLKSCLLKHESLNGENAVSAERACQELTRRVTGYKSTSSSSYSCLGLFFKLILFIAVIVAVVLSADVYIHNNEANQDDEVVRVLKDYGADVYIHKSAQVIYDSYHEAANFFNKQVLPWIGTVLKIIDPLVSKVVAWSIETIKYLIEVTTPQREWFIKNVPLYIDWVIMHPIWSDIYNYMMAVYAVIEPYINIAYNKISDLSAQGYQYVSSKLQ